MTRPRRSLLFVPGSSPRALQKARELACDVVILDLEDAVAPGAKEAARAAVVAAMGDYRQELLVRVNAPGSLWIADDLAALAGAKPKGIVIPKVESAEQIEQIKPRAHGLPLWVMIETPRGLAACDAIAASGVAALVLGSNDLLKNLGGRHMPGRENLFAAMGTVLATARAHGLAAFDGVHNDMSDADGLVRSCRQARDFGFDGKSLIHPDQIAPANAAFTPTAEEMDEARAVIAAFAADPGKGAVAFRGRMIEELDAQIAARILNMHSASGA